MRREFLKKAVAGSLPLEFIPPAGEHRGPGGVPHERTRSMTTLVSMRCGDQGVLCGADRQTTSWFSVFASDSEKIHIVAPNALLMGSGAVSSIQLAEGYLTSLNGSMREQYGIFLTVRGQARAFSRWCRSAYYWYGDFVCYSILTGLDPDGQFSMYEIDADGALHQRREFATSGSGGSRAQGVLDLRWQEDLSYAKALDVIVDALYEAGHRDLGTSSVLVSIPRVMWVNRKRMVSVIPDEDVIVTLLNVLKRKRGDHHKLFRALLDASLKESPKKADAPAAAPAPAESAVPDKEGTDV